MSAYEACPTSSERLFVSGSFAQSISLGLCWVKSASSSCEDTFGVYFIYLRGVLCYALLHKDGVIGELRVNGVDCLSGLS